MMFDRALSDGPTLFERLTHYEIFADLRGQRDIVQIFLDLIVGRSHADIFFPYTSRVGCSPR